MTDIRHAQYHVWFRWKHVTALLNLWQHTYHSRHRSRLSKIWMGRTCDFLITDKHSCVLVNFQALGINITSNLRWSTHIQSLSLKWSEVCYIIKSLRDDLSFNILRNIYFAKFQSLVRYGIIFWGGENECSKVLKLQKGVLHIMKGVNRWESCRVIFKELKISVYLWGVELFARI
jgi:hypothetical protein